MAVAVVEAAALAIVPALPDEKLEDDRVQLVISEYGGGGSRSFG